MARKKTSDNLLHLNASIANTIRDCRKEIDMTQIELAKAVGVDQSLISRMEKSGYDHYDLSLIWQIFDVFNLEIKLEIDEREDDGQC